MAPSASVPSAADRLGLRTRLRLVAVAVALAFVALAWIRANDRMAAEQRRIGDRAQDNAATITRALDAQIEQVETLLQSVAYLVDVSAAPVHNDTILRAIFRTKTRDEWCEIMEATDVCFAPVLTMSEAAAHPHNRERRTFVEANGHVQPAPAPRFSRTVPEIGRASAHPGQHTADVLRDWGIDGADALMASGGAKQA